MVFMLRCVVLQPNAETTMSKGRDKPGREKKKPKKSKAK
jgi:hypothetical protein